MTRTRDGNPSGEALVPAGITTLAIDPDAPVEQLEQAARMLSTGTGTVVLNGALILRSSAARLLCDVIDPEPRSRRCENEFAVLLENAQRMLASSRLAPYLPGIPRVWRVVEETDTGTTVLWRPA